MNKNRTVFAQLMDFVPRHAFRSAVRRYRGDHRVRQFTCWEQFLCMSFAQLTYRESLRDIEACLRSLGPRLYHSGLQSHIARSTLADANEQRPWQIYHSLALTLIDRARLLYRKEPFLAELDHVAYAFDSTTIELCLTLFPWARAAGHVDTSAAIKLHTLLDLRSKIPTFIRVSSASVHDVKMLDELTYEAGALYIFDRGYTDFKRLYTIDEAKAFFVIRAKDSLRCRRVYSHSVDKSTGLRSDQTVRFEVWHTLQQYPSHLRRVRFFDQENNRYLVFLTNNFELDALVIAQLYRERWNIELFFKWIKQHLRLKAFYGTSPNAVRTQIWIAVSMYVLVAIIKKELRIDLSLYTILQILSVSLFEKEHILQLLTASQHRFQQHHAGNQLILFDFLTGQ